MPGAGTGTGCFSDETGLEVEDGRGAVVVVAERCSVPVEYNRAIGATYCLPSPTEKTGEAPSVTKGMYRA